MVQMACLDMLGYNRLHLDFTLKSKNYSQTVCRQKTDLQ